jgi:hypothetical protein
VVYLIGVGQDQTEVQRVIDHARDVPYVRAVETYVRLKSDPLPPEPPPPAKAPEIMPAEVPPETSAGTASAATDTATGETAP